MYDAATWVSSAGLFSDLVGVILIWRYGLPEAVSRKGASYYMLEETDEAEVQKAARYDLRSRVGIGLVAAGFPAADRAPVHA